MVLQGKRGIVFGVANEYSNAWAIAKAAHEHGAQLAITYQNERFEETVRKLAATLNDPLVLQCDVAEDKQVLRVYDEIANRWGSLDFVVHSIAFAPGTALRGKFLETTRTDFLIAHDISVYSFIAVTRPAVALMSNGGSVLTLTYLGSERAVPGYNVMGVCKAALEACVRYLAAELGEHNIRVNALSPGPIKTLAARGIPGFTKMLDIMKERAPLRRSTTQEEVGKAAVFLLSDYASAITGEIIYLDCGYRIMGM
ncbi:Enoyl-[acyl-carrier-protein] reductase [NADH] FabI [bacterium HR17]|uniref:Enoyl-[acyl-carrier-protein] reductase [NADH] n=1 Tax=Candidatus Fervidibacter japonicus TaxID=2035412 RepID=A0A2H5XC64_9BACT|nr:Enoyl-[acyl-carrier-protein] reductase [NADH] FabI [bacterium HR17]